MSKLDEMKKNYENIEIPEELRERVEKVKESRRVSTVFFHLQKESAL